MSQLMVWTLPEGFSFNNDFLLEREGKEGQMGKSMESN